MFEAYLADLRRELGGPLLLRAGMVREIRHGLNDAAQARRAAGAGRREAERLAVEEFGPAEVVAAELRPELAASAGRYLGMVAFVGGTVLFALTQRSWQVAAAEQGWPDPSPAYATLAGVVDAATVAFVLFSALGVLALDAGSRFLPPRGTVRALAYGLLAVLVFEIASGVVLSAFAPGDIGSASMLDAAAGAASMLIIVWFAALALRCLWLTSARRAGA